MQISLHTLLDDTIDKSNSAATEKSVEDSDIVEDEKEKKEDPIELKKESYLIEQWDDDTDLYGNRYDDMEGFSEFEPAAEEMASTADDESPDSASLEQIAAEFGFSGAPGARQHIEKLTSSSPATPSVDTRNPEGELKRSTIESPWQDQTVTTSLDGIEDKSLLDIMEIDDNQILVGSSMHAEGDE